MSTSKDSLKNLNPEQFEQKGGQESKNQDVADKVSKETQSSTSTEQKNVDQQQPVSDATSSDQSNNTEDNSKYVNYLVNTFGFSENEITDKALKLAKSNIEVQSNWTKSRQTAVELEDQVNGVKSIFENNPEVYDYLVKKSKGENVENLSIENRKPSLDNSQQNVGKLNTSNEAVSEQVLVKEGYLKPEDLEGLDDLAKDRKIFKAELAYEADHARQRVRQGIQEEHQQFQQKQQQQEATQVNQERFSDGFDQYVLQYGVNPENITDDQLRAIKKQVALVPDPDNNSFIAKDAFEIVANRVLGNSFTDKNPISNNSKSVEQLQDTGTSFNSRMGGQKTDVSLQEQLSRAAKEDFLLNSKRTRFKEKINF